jgi:signal transduction histidine kinase
MLKKAFEPYFSTKDAGTGLGLSIAQKIIEGHRGSIQISSKLRKGTEVLIKFPVS